MFASIPKVGKVIYTSVQIYKSELFLLVYQVVDTQCQVNRDNTLKKVMPKAGWQTRLTLK